ncbi:hypothetical protein LTR85_000193 [Meristemomyces frigidus]|nr:hypothetical protein LTR85_000193 [Meristemomyces frigidus]
MSFFQDTPFVASSRDDVDGLITIVWVLVIVGAVVDIGYHFHRAIKTLLVEKRTSRRRRNVRMWEIGVFLVIAIVALGVVNGLRWEHRRLKLASWDAIEQSVDQWRLQHPDALLGKEPKRPILDAATKFTQKLTHAAEVDVSNLNTPSISDVKEALVDTKDSVVKNARKLPSKVGEAKEALVDTKDSLKKTYNNARMPKGEEIVKGAKKSARNAAKAVSNKAEKARKSSWVSVTEALQGTEEQVKVWRKQSSRWLYGNVPITNELTYSFPWSRFGPKKETSVWDFFKTLVDEALHFWWTQQWMAGYLAWAVFVGIESRNRDLPAFAFIVFGYCFSVAASQSLYYALLLLKPAPLLRRKQNWMPHQAVAILPIAFEVLGLAYLPSAYQRIIADKSTLFLSAPVFFNVLQASLVALPAVIAVVIRDYLPLSWGTRRASSADAKKDLLLFWYIISLTALALHIFSTVRAFYEAWTMMPRWLSFFYGPIKLKKPGYSEARVSGFASILGQLGSHDRLGAVAWDVVLSTGSLCYWATVSSADVRSMLKCSLWPWIDETIEAVQEGAGVLQEKAERYMEAMQEGVDHFQEVAEPYAKDLRKRAKKTMKTAGPYLETAHEYMDEGLDQAARYARNAVNLAAAQGPPGYSCNAHSIARALGYSKGGEQEEDDMPEEDDHVDDSEWTEVRRGRAASPKKRGRPAKSQRSASKSPAPPPGGAASRSRTRTSERPSSPTKRRSSRIKKLAAPTVNARSRGRHGGEDGDDTEPWYRRASRIEVSEELAGDFEAAGLTMGLFVVGGLGMASASVFGGDETH